MTLTFYQRSADEATGIHVATNEDQLSTTTTTLSTENRSIAAGASELPFVFTTASGQPNQADWGNGTYRAQINVTAIGADTTTGIRTIGSAAGHFARVDTGLTADLETATQAEAGFTGTGLKLATVSWSPAAGATDNRFEILLAAQNVGSMSQNLQLTLNTTDSYADGPFDVVAAFAPPPFQRRWRYLKRRRVS